MAANLRERLRLAFANWLIGIADSRPPNFVVGGTDGRPVYLRRWFLLPRNPLLNLYLHEFVNDDDDRALHDHPWFSASLTLQGTYREVLPLKQSQSAGWDYTEHGLHTRLRFPGAVVFRRARMRHRIEVFGGASAWTLFLTGPTIREWGFHCRHGWVPFGNFLDSRDKGAIGAGCDGAPRRPLPIWKVWKARNS